MKRSIQNNVRQRIAANRQRAADVMEQEARDREAMRLLNEPERTVFIMEQVQPEPDDIVGRCAASILRVTKIG